jgi:hypothetical protein
MRLVFPWADEEFEGSAFQKDFIYGKLRALGFPVRMWRKANPVEEFEEAVQDVFDELRVVESPWMILASNDARYLQALAEVIPIVYALSTKVSVHWVSTPQMVDMLKSPPPVDDWEDDPVGEKLEAIETAGLVVWKNGHARVMASQSLEGRYEEVFERSYREGDILVLTCHVPKVSKDALKKIGKRLMENLGESFIQRFTVKKFVRGKQRSSEWSVGA